MTDSSYNTMLNNLGITPPATTPKVSSAAQQQTLGQADFLKLMTAQMQNQDPFNPVDNTQMVAQMAQFSSLAGISDMSTTLKAIAQKLGAANPSDAMAYVGKTVLTAGDTAYPRASGGIAGAVALDGDADTVTVTIKSADGTVMKTETLDHQAKGTVSFDWDGKTASGAAAGDGPFTVEVSALKAGEKVKAQPLVWAPVQSVSMPASGDPVLTVVGVGQIPTSAVLAVG